MIYLETRCVFSRAKRNHLKGVHCQSPWFFQGFFLQLLTNSFSSRFSLWCPASSSSLSMVVAPQQHLHLVCNASAEVLNAAEKSPRGSGQQQRMEGDLAQMCSQLECLPGSFRDFPVAAAPCRSCRSWEYGGSWETELGKFVTARAFPHKRCSAGTTALKTSLANGRRIGFSWGWGRVGWDSKELMR